MNKKAQAIPVGGALLAIILFGILIFYILPQLTPILQVGIILNEQEIKENNVGVLSYTLLNNKREDLENVIIVNSIVGKEYISNYNVTENLGTLPGRTKISKIYSFDTDYLSKGNYVIKTEVFYSYKGEQKREELILQFKVI